MARKQGTKVKYVDDQDTDDEDSFEPMLHVHSVNHVNKVDPIMLYPSIQWSHTTNGTRHRFGSFSYSGTFL